MERNTFGERGGKTAFEFQAVLVSRHWCNAYLASVSSSVNWEEGPRPGGWDCREADGAGAREVSAPGVPLPQGSGCRGAHAHRPRGAGAEKTVRPGSAPQASVRTRARRRARAGPARAGRRPFGVGQPAPVSEPPMRTHLTAKAGSGARLRRVRR